MTLAHTTAIRNGLADYVADAHDTGGGTAVLQIRQSSTVLVEFDLPNPAFGAASTGVVTLLGVPIATTADASGTADNFITKDRRWIISQDYNALTAVAAGREAIVSTAATAASISRSSPGRARSIGAISTAACASCAASRAVSR